MSKYIYLYGKGETNTAVGNQKKNSTKKQATKSAQNAAAQTKEVDLVGVEQISVKGGCYIKCEIPLDALELSGFFPSVLHAYMMYAKDIGLKVTDVLFDSSFKNRELLSQLVYSLWPLFYVNNSGLFTNQAPNSGLNVWEITKQTKAKFEVTLNTRIKMDTHYSIFYHDTAIVHESKDLPNNSNLAANPIPAPGNVVQATGSWYLQMDLPVKDSGHASPYAIIQNYNHLVVWDTLLDMQKNINAYLTAEPYKGLKPATGSVLKAVMDRPYAYDQLMPKWNPQWGAEPDSYRSQALSVNDYNIGASLFVSDRRQDPAVADLMLLCTALNIKGKVKSGHAETRLLLTLDAVDNANKQTAYSGSNWFSAVCEFYEFDEANVQVRNIYQHYENQNISLISSLKPCYLCTGEVDATVDGLINTINGKTVNMWACFSFLEYKPKIKKVLYFDVDRPISYPSYLKTSIYVDGHERYDWEIYLAPWTQWSAFMNTQPAAFSIATSPIGPRVVEPAGECLKTGEAYNRYKNSERLLLASKRDYLAELDNLLVGIGYDEVDDSYE